MRKLPAESVLDPPRLPPAPAGERLMRASGIGRELARATTAPAREAPAPSWVFTPRAVCPAATLTGSRALPAWCFERAERKCVRGSTSREEVPVLVVLAWTTAE